jgi:hypothetical protein
MQGRFTSKEEDEDEHGEHAIIMKNNGINMMQAREETQQGR